MMTFIIYATLTYQFQSLGGALHAHGRIQNSNYQDFAIHFNLFLFEKLVQKVNEFLHVKEM